MKKGIKLIAAIGAAAAVMLSATDAGAAIGGASNGSSFAAVASTTVQPQSGSTALPVNCKPGDATNRSSSRMVLSMTGDTTGASSVGNLGNANRVKASWPGGSMWLTQVGRNYTTPKSAKFPCPATDTAPMTITFQPYRGSKKVGTAAQSQIPVAYVGPRVVRQFAAWPSIDTIDLNCKPNTKTKTLTKPFKLMTTLNLNGADPAMLGDDLNRATSYRATWNGGSATLRKLGQWWTVSGGAKFPCPDPAKQGSRTVSITVQGYRGALKVGAPAHINLGLFNQADPGSKVESTKVTNNTNGTTVGQTSPASSSDPVQAAVTLPPGVNGDVVIKESATSSTPKPTGYTFFGKSVHIDAPNATVASPLVLTFRFYAPVGTLNDKTVKLYRDGQAAGECAGKTTAEPDACIKSRSRDGDNVVLVVNTSHASDWDAAKQDGFAS